MAEGFEPYHVPQQSRRDKLRVVTTQPPPGCVDNLQGCASLVPLYDHSLISSSDLIANVQRHSYGVKEEGMINLMGLAGQGITANNHMFLDPQLSVHLNPNTTIQDINNSPYAYFRGVLDYQHHQSIQEPSCNSSGQSLSLSLSSHHTAHNLPLELNLQRYDSNSMFENNSNNGNKVSGGGFLVACNNGGSGSGSTSIELSKSTVPLGPFTGYASVLRGSRFLKPAQLLLEELCDVGRGIYADKTGGGADSSLLDPPPLESLDDSLNSSDGAEQTRKKSRLISMLDEVYKRYKQYYQQMQAAVAAFESVAGLSNAAPFANFALKAMYKHFRCLKNAITAQLQFTSKSHGKINSDRSDDTQRIETPGRSTFGQRAFQNSGFVDQPVWRPQRGLPERAVTVLRAWLFEHFLHPYPTDTDKIMLAKQTGLSRNQVSNWFINARVRLWKPMVEEIHMLETGQTQKPSSQRDQEQQTPPNTHTNQIPNSIDCENASTSFQRIGETFPNLKRTRDDPIETPRPTIKLPYDNLLQNNSHLGLNGMGNAGGNSGVSLTLGLHQNGGVGLSDSYPINAARRFGLDSSHGEGFVVSGFAAQNTVWKRSSSDY